MVTQDQLFHEDWRDALRHTVKALGGCEAVGVELFPGKTRRAAGIWLSDCLNPERPAKLDLEEIIALMQFAREQGVHTAMHMLADFTQYERPKIAAPKSKETELAEKIAAHAAEMARLQREADLVAQAKALKSAV